MTSYREEVQQHYQTQWDEMQLDTSLGASGWRTIVPAPHFADFVAFLKDEGISGRALDIGCGGGRYSFELAKAGFEVYGVDFVDTAIETAKERADELGLSDNTHFQQGNVLDLSFDEDFFDVANDDGCFHHIGKEDWPLYIENLKRVLRPGGIYKLKVIAAGCGYQDRKSGGSNESWINLGNGHHTYFFEQSELRELFEPHLEIRTFEKMKHPVSEEKEFHFMIARNGMA